LAGSFLSATQEAFEEAIMDFQFAERPVGGQLGTEGYDRLVERAEAVCECERQRIEIINQPLIEVKKAEYGAQLEKGDELKARIYQAKPPHEHRARRRRIIYCWTVVSVLVIAGFVLSLLTLEPFQLGLKGLFYCLGIAIAVPYLVEGTLNRLSSEKLVRVLVTVSSIVALVSLMTLAVIRGELLAKHTREASPAVTIEGDDPQPAQAKPSFYDDTVPLLQIVMVLLAFAMEVGAGIAVHEAERVSANLGDSYDELQRAREVVQAKLAELGQEILALQSEPGLFVSKFWRDFHWAVLKRSVGNAAKAFALGALGLLFAFPARAQKPLELVILIDLRQSVRANGPDHRSEFQKNVAAVSEVLRHVPAGAHITVVGITDDSFAQPYFLLSATVTGDTGYFGEKIDAARQRLANAWKKRSREMTPSFPGTDLLGAFLIASQVFAKAGPGKHDELVVFSDMWQETREFDFARTRERCKAELITQVKSRRLVVNLRDADVYVLGVDSAGRTKSDWLCARQFWTAYFAEAGAALRDYSVLRQMK
jgi:hypothetical protein